MVVIFSGNFYGLVMARVPLSRLSTPNCSCAESSCSAEEANASTENGLNVLRCLLLGFLFAARVISF